MFPNSHSFRTDSESRKYRVNDVPIHCPHSSKKKSYRDETESAILGLGNGRNYHISWLCGPSKPGPIVRRNRVPLPSLTTELSPIPNRVRPFPEFCGNFFLPRNLDLKRVLSFFFFSSSNQNLKPKHLFTLTKA